MMKNNLKTSVAAFLFLVVGVLFYIAFADAADDDVMTVEANVLNGSSGGGDIVRVEVPDYLFFGNVTKGQKSEEFKVYVNNTGTVDITVTPKLTDESEDVFGNLYFRSLQTHNGSTVPYSRIGDFSFNITKPVSGSTSKSAYFYVVLDLTDYDIDRDVMGHKADVKFIAVAK